jgi:hypothetical protein
MVQEYLSFELWTDVKRFPEYAAFQLVMGIRKSSVVWQIYEQHIGYDQQQDYRMHVRRVYGAYCFFAGRHRGLRDSDHVELAARKFGISAREVRIAIQDARLFCVPALMDTAPAVAV